MGWVEDAIEDREDAYAYEYAQPSRAAAELSDEFYSGI
jgi:hypothetical protein